MADSYAVRYRFFREEAAMNRLDHDEVRLRVQAAPELLYDLVCDIPRTPQWSPEVVACRWLDGAAGAVPGARFSARNKRRWFTWSNKPVVETAERGSEFAITRTEPGGGTIRWFYRFDPGPDGTMTELGYQVLRPVPLFLHLILRAVFGGARPARRLAPEHDHQPAPTSRNRRTPGPAGTHHQPRLRHPGPRCRQTAGPVPVMSSGVPARRPALTTGPSGKAPGGANVGDHENERFGTRQATLLGTRPGLARCRWSQLRPAS
jgi:Polyketide cyclase / dehydrase and lipid transport